MHTDPGRPLHRIMFVEDNPDITLVARLALEKIGGFEVRFCASAEEALDAVEAFKPDMILLDVMLPGMDGPTLLQRLRQLEECRETPFIFVTAKAQAKELRELKATGVVDVIAKPFDALNLASQLKEIWSGVPR